MESSIGHGVPVKQTHIKRARLRDIVWIGSYCITDGNSKKGKHERKKFVIHTIHFSGGYLESTGPVEGIRVSRLRAVEKDFRAVAGFEREKKTQTNQ
jgi:hypothetical protein